MSGRDVLRRSLVSVLLLGVVALVLTGLRLTDADRADRAATPASNAAGTPDAAEGAPAARTARGALLLAPGSRAEDAAVHDLLVRRARAVLERDRAGWAATVTPPGGVPDAGQMQLYHRLATLRPVGWAYGGATVTVPEGEAGPSGERKLSVGLNLAYRLSADGPRTVRAQTLTVTGEHQRWWVSAAPAPDQSGARAGVDLWDISPIQRAVGARCLVIGAPAQSAWVSWLARHCGAAQAKVDAAVPGAAARPARTLLVVPADLADLADLLGRADTAGLDRTAAITIGPVGKPAESVLINGAAFRQLRAVGRRVVLTHEFVHVATRATQTTTVPVWLDEGLADEIAYRGTGLAPATIAGPVIQAARAGSFPAAFPAAADFDATGSDPAGAYARSWSAADTIAARVGLARLVELHRLVGSGHDEQRSFRRLVGVSEAGFPTLWREHLQQLAADPSSAR